MHETLPEAVKAGSLRRAFHSNAPHEASEEWRPLWAYEELGCNNN